MRTDLFDFELPAERIALRPASPRDAARLLVVRPGGAPALEDRALRDLPELLQPGDCLVVNDSKVIAARLTGRRIGRGEGEPAIEATLHKRLDGSHWRAFVRPAKKLQTGDTMRFGTEGRVCFLDELDAQVSHKDEGGEITLSFSFHGPVLDQAIAERGDMPLPPYIASRREPDEQDRTDYQTVFARDEGSVAAPTAGLHFTDELLARLSARGVAVHKVTLHVGAGTFLPVKSRGHRRPSTCMPSSARFRPRPRPRSTPRAPKAGASWRSARPRCGCWKARPARTALWRAFSGETAIFITPGYRFKAVDLMLTNFHLPRSTLFMLVAAFSGLDVDEKRLRPRHRGRLSVLFLRRRLPAVSGRTMSAPFSFTLIKTDGAARRGEFTTPHGTVQTPAFMPVGTQAHGEGAHARDRARPPAPRSCSATPIT